MRSRRPAIRWPLTGLGALPAVAVLVGLMVEAQTAAALAAAIERLRAGDLPAAAARLDPLRFSPFHRSRAAGARALAAALRGDPAGAIEGGLTGLPVRAGLDAALRRGDFAAVERAAVLASESGAPFGGLYRAAAAVEAGDASRARLHLESLDPALREDPLAQRVAAAVIGIEAGHGTRVRDRRGEPLGHLDAVGALTLDPAVDPALVPEAVRGPLIRARGAAGARLSIDLELSRLALRALGDYRGSIVLVDAWTGAVLAAVSDPRTARRFETPALEQYREPASIAKLITSAAALRVGLDPEQEIAGMSCDGATRYPTGILWCPWGGGRPRGLDHAMAVSCNTSFAELGGRVGRAGVVAEFRRWGFDREAPDLPGSGRVVEPEGDARQLGDLAIGLEATDITPLHAALMAAVFANGGSMPAPRFVVSVDGRLGRNPRALPRSKPRRVIPETWVPRLRQAMRTVAAPGGTGAHLAPEGFPVAMKTGTAALPGAGYHVNYIGIGPVPDARLAFEIRVTHQRNSRRVRRAARNVTRALLEGLAGHAGRLRWPGPADPARPAGGD